ncbi:hypothetical protein N7494_000483 [Penicillium frequentans]|uniref:Alpha/beta hydrolase fold-3 domain-containing protein n=1 Tax=Penicillium frequentans TaxID=3151616 RepID=A0AAD6D5W9_9EURO|nr:hypothetical protein N7494_000483 [Penicillium glabrum]
MGLGGGYVMPLSPGHLDWLAYIQKEAVSAGVDVSMAQAIEALKAILASGYDACDIIFGGDSAGGHLSMSLLAHLHRFRPQEPGFSGQVELNGKIKGSFLVSPLASFNTRAFSYQRICSVDVLNAWVVGEWGKLLVKDTQWHEEVARGNGWGMALDVPEQWWDALNVVNRIMVTGGDQEVFRDHVVQLIDVLRRRTKADVMGFISSTEAHDGPLMDFMFKSQPGESARRIAAWVIESFKV